MSEGTYDDAQDVAEEAAPEQPVAMAGQASIAQTHGAEASPSRRRGQGRRVTLAHPRQGGYSIWMQSRHIQGFCAEWEDVTNFQLPDGFEQQVRIHVEAVGEAREIRPEYSGEQVERALERRPAPDPNEARLNQLRERRRQPWDGADLVQMFYELPEHQREIIAGQIWANYQQVNPFGDPQVAARPVAEDRAQRIRSDAVQDTMNRVERMLVSVIEEMRRL